MKIVWMSEVELSLDGGSHIVDFSIRLRSRGYALLCIMFFAYRTIVKPW